MSPPPQPPRVWNAFSWKTVEMNFNLGTEKIPLLFWRSYQQASWGQQPPWIINKSAVMKVWNTEIGIQKASVHHWARDSEDQSRGTKRTGGVGKEQSILDLHDESMLSLKQEMLRQMGTHCSPLHKHGRETLIFKDHLWMSSKKRLPGTSQDRETVAGPTCYLNWAF